MLIHSKQVDGHSRTHTPLARIDRGGKREGDAGVDRQVHGGRQGAGAVGGAGVADHDGVGVADARHEGGRAVGHQQVD